MGVKEPCAAVAAQGVGARSSIRAGPRDGDVPPELALVAMEVPLPLRVAVPPFRTDTTPKPL